MGNCGTLMLDEVKYKETFLTVFHEGRKGYFPERRLPTPADKGKLWVNGIGFVDECVAAEFVTEETDADVVSHIRKDLDEFARKRIAFKMEQKKEDSGDNFFPMTPPRVSRDVTCVDPKDTLPAPRTLSDFCYQNPAQNPDIIGTALFNSMQSQSTSASMVPSYVPAPNTPSVPHDIAGTYENPFGQFEVSGPFAAGDTFTLTVRQLNTDGTITTGTLAPNTNGEWEGNLINRGSIFGHIRLASTPAGLSSTFRVLGSTTWGAVMHAKKLG